MTLKIGGVVVEVMLPGKVGRVQPGIGQYRRPGRKGPVSFEPVEVANDDVVQNSVDGPEPRTRFLPARPAREHRQDRNHLLIYPLVVTGQV